MAIDRRDFLKIAATTALISFPMISKAITQSKGRIVVIGGGYAGATAAKYLRSWSNGSLDVIMVEPRTQFVSCPLSNLVLGGTKNINELTFGYDMLKSNHGIQWVSDEVVAIDTSDRVVKMKRGELAYDRLIIAPGIDFMYEQLPVLQSEEAQLAVPHAWKAGVQTVNLRKQLESMKDGGVFVISIPKAPYRCPPGPYERVSQVAFYLKNHKPNSKIIVLDANAEIISKKGLFTKVWAEMYAGMIDYRPNSSVVDVDVVAKTVKTEFESVRADVLNVIPPQRAGKIAQIAGVANVDKRWCEVDFLTYESKIIPNVHLIGDSVSAALPKSAHMATSQARVCANAIVALMSNQLPDSAPVFANTCYSYVSDKMAMHVANVYRYDPNKKIMVSAEGGGVSEKPSELEGNYAQAWAKNIWSDVLT
ncbi:MAG: NAD(P)/FAD-dependent oxidoreductase [Methylophilaceae bacterium]|jgi:NADPH-dependent 2,4-dienoyl-CoA reductase/sulfur reductase-like enzyme